MMWDDEIIITYRARHTSDTSDGDKHTSGKDRHTTYRARHTSDTSDGDRHTSGKDRHTTYRDRHTTYRDRLCTARLSDKM